MSVDILNPPLLRLTSRKPLWLDLAPVDIKSRWKHNWKSAQVVNSHLVCDPTTRQPGFDLPRQQWSLLNRFRTGKGHCGACRKKWRLTATDLCPCGETQTMSYVVPRIHTELVRRAFSVAAKSTWNSLPADIRLCENILTFKRHLKTHLFKLT